MRTTQRNKQTNAENAVQQQRTTAPPVARSSGVVVGLPRRGTCMRAGCGRRLPRWGGRTQRQRGGGTRWDGGRESRVAPYGISRWGTGQCRARPPVHGEARRGDPRPWSSWPESAANARVTMCAPRRPGRGLFLPANVSRCRGFSRTARPHYTKKKEKKTKKG
jgi:hypothetical protein